jgi:hypothetical protein
VSDAAPAPRTLAEAAEAAGLPVTPSPIGGTVRLRCSPSEIERTATKLAVRLRAHGAPDSTTVDVRWRVGSVEAIVEAEDLAAGLRRRGFAPDGSRLPTDAAHHGEAIVTSAAADTIGPETIAALNTGIAPLQSAPARKRKG